MKKPNKKSIKIAISSSSDNIEGSIDSRFGRCSFFLIITLEDGKITDVKAIENNQRNMQGQVGIVIAQMLAKEDIDTVITENIGPRALDVLSQFQISVFKGEGTIKDSIKCFKDNKLEQIG